MSIDIFQSRRNYNEPCRWWSRNDSDEYEDNELIMKRVPTGFFMAKEITSEQNQNISISNSFMFEKTTITIKTPDNVYGIKTNDLVEYQNEKWIVVNVQRQKHRIQNTQNAPSNQCSHFWFIELRK